MSIGKWLRVSATNSISERKRLGHSPHPTWGGSSLKWHKPLWSIFWKLCALLITKQRERNTWTRGMLQTFPFKKWECQHSHCTLTPWRVFCKRKDVLQVLKLLYPKFFCSENAVIQTGMLFRRSVNKEKREGMQPCIRRYIRTRNLYTYFKILFYSAYYMTSLFKESCLQRWS